ncbi:MAG: J domain-containing protein, partial [Clostridiales bacterium]|nr:J domain-containing protein [Clostridiales bacterium]
KDSDEKIKAAYKEMVKKYHPDNHQESPLSDLADEKMAEINGAFDEIMNIRRGGSHASEFENYQNGTTNQDYQNNQYNQNNPNSDYVSIRNLIRDKNITQADNMLNAISSNERVAEWYFLKGSICYTRGWVNEAAENFTMASTMDPSNPEYKAALEQMNRNRGGYMNGNPNPQYNTQPNTSGCSGCDICQGLICADCCCECMGGDLISCC